MNWEVWYYTDSNKVSMEIIANSFDEAIAKARQIDAKFMAGRVKESV